MNVGTQEMIEILEKLRKQADKNSLDNSPFILLTPREAAAVVDLLEDKISMQFREFGYDFVNRRPFPRNYYE